MFFWISIRQISRILSCHRFYSKDWVLEWTLALKKIAWRSRGVVTPSWSKAESWLGSRGKAPRKFCFCFRINIEYLKIFFSFLPFFKANLFFLKIEFQNSILDSVSATVIRLQKTPGNMPGRILFCSEFHTFSDGLSLMEFFRILFLKKVNFSTLYYSFPC